MVQIAVSSQYSNSDFQQAARNLADAGQALYQKGWSPATSSNYSQRLSFNCCAITISGKDKSTLNPSDIMVVDFEGKPLTPGKPSAETLLHTGLYQCFKDIEAVLHIHSPTVTILSRLLTGQTSLEIKGYELLKAFHDITTHDTSVTIPIFENTQAIDQLAAAVNQYLEVNPQTYGYIIRDHGLYTWGRDIAEAHRHLEAWDFLLGCELELIKLGFL